MPIRGQTMRIHAEKTRSRSRTIHKPTSAVRDFAPDRYKDCSTFANASMSPHRMKSTSLPIATDAKPKGNYAFISLGCPKNTVDSERMLGKLAQDGYALQAGRRRGRRRRRQHLRVHRAGPAGVARRHPRDARPQEGRARSGRSSSPAAWPSGKRDVLLEEVPGVDQIVGVFGREEIAQVVDRAVAPAARAAVAVPPRPGPGARRHRPPADHAAALRLPEDQRGLRPALHLLRDPGDARQARHQADRGSRPRGARTGRRRRPRTDRRRPGHDLLRHGPVRPGAAGRAAARTGQGRRHRVDSRRSTPTRSTSPTN